ncbi:MULTISPECIES: YceI family protein [unclassified Neisseria]|uniref:YceI family protein n=1 Tax=unclassified Neisseria TaxID=2623750 RepID=UPI0026663BD2|nr:MULTISPECIES: YceI family protein [unclassified Neisseria]MDO1508829.1 YceI family protein [Neisseria sp. MVDL19-042950]MDO1515088.1 YceI family protein [Neisseria sp. MVDL18-041461]MDO1562448.1 YceI family protein [Neisseria sp. MVDL20-010259]
MFKKALIVSTSLLALAACSPSETAQSAQPAAEAVQAVPQTPADWEVSNAGITFLSSKINKQLGSVTEQSRFTASQAMLGKDGEFKMEVDLSSVNTGIEIRDQRLKDWVFETAKFAKANVTGKVDVDTVNKLAIGETVNLKQPLVLDIHGKQINLEADLSAQRISADKIMVSTLSPVLLDVKAMDMVGGVAQLVEVMGLSSIVQQVPVSFNAEFTRKE